jgi:glycosyltransferase involved in cell wall biosynthesis
MSRIAAVVIGRNEGERLIRCLGSMAGMDHVVYVDSGSTDGSVAAAKATGATVVTLEMDRPFTAARARNAGVAALEAAGAAPDYVQFIDGDCTLSSGWIATAQAWLDANPQTAVACGRRRELYPEASVFNRLCDMEWNTPVGESAACGGDSLMRLTAFHAAGGFDPALIAGEEPELCLRLRRGGWTIWRLDAEMTAHDAAIHRFGQWWRRAVRGGWAYAEGAAMHGAGPERYKAREARSVLVWGGVLPAALAATLAVWAAGAEWAGCLAVAMTALWPAMAARIALGRRRRFGDGWRNALTYGVFVMLGKPAQMQGLLRYWRTHLGGGAARLIEYKGADKAPGS